MAYQPLNRKGLAPVLCNIRLYTPKTDSLWRW